MPSLPKSIFDESNQNTNAHKTTNQASTSEPSDQLTTTKTTAYDPEVSSIFTQTTINDSSPSQPTTTSSRFGFLKRNKSKNDAQQQSLISSEGANAEGKEERKKKPRFENPFKAHEQTDEDRAIMERMRERLGSREEAIRQGGAQPAGFRGEGGGYAAGGPWTGGM
ncbi:hypothetical protein E4T39_02421 [Aureobasidium subglaciale]|nr:hypothetical protein E4T39_02421 [Aureobasidium subglaciale]